MPPSSPSKMRLDRLLYEKSLVESREKAKALIMQGSVTVNGIVVDKAGTLVDANASLNIENKMPFVSRGGLKLDHAINEFHILTDGLIAMDIGASTGGFTDCLLQQGSKKVYAVDVGYGQLHWKLRNNERVVILEKTNIRHLGKDDIQDEIDLITIDVSFISLAKVIPKALEFLKPSGEIVALIKPQFEAGRKDVGKGGVVRDEKKREEIIHRIKGECKTMGLIVEGVTESPIKGPKGNIEYLIYLKRGSGD
jgi:23S rRNA (cytidine1920-2'-O)/16S rRNA (cytidine1409-2'-O)-methyltransferase